MSHQQAEKLAPVEITAVQFDDGSYGVQMEISGLGSEDDALACMQHVFEMFGGQQATAGSLQE